MVVGSLGLVHAYVVWVSKELRDVNGITAHCLGAGWASVYFHPLNAFSFFAISPLTLRFLSLRLGRSHQSTSRCPGLCPPPQVQWKRQPSFLMAGYVPPRGLASSQNWIALSTPRPYPHRSQPTSLPLVTLASRSSLLRKC